jgi:hypothetical protein
MRWIEEKLPTVKVGDIVDKEFFAFFPARAKNKDGDFEYRWLERVKVRYIIQPNRGWDYGMGETIQERFTHLEPLKFLD